MENDVVDKTFRALIESADRKFARLRDVPPYGKGPTHCIHKAFKAYMRLWKYQQENRSKLVASPSRLQRWEIGEIASRIGQLYFNQYMRTSDARFLLESYVFYDAILNRNYFDGSAKDRAVRFKDLRFCARFLLVSLILNRSDMVSILVQRFKSLVDDSKSTFRETNFKEWKQVVQEVVRFVTADTAFIRVRPLRYCVTFDSYSDSLPYVVRFHAKKFLKFRDAILTSYHRNEVKYAELTLDTFRMLQCLEWEPNGSFYQKHPNEPSENGVLADHSGASGFINMNLAADMTDPTLPPNPKKAILYRPSVTQLIAVIATICEELPPDSVMLIYLSAPGNSGCTTKFTNLGVASHSSHELNCSKLENHVKDKGEPNQLNESCLWFGPCKYGGPNSLYPGDLIPFTRKPLFFIIDSDNSHAFKVLHGAERGEPTALLLSPLRPSFKNQTSTDVTLSGSQFTMFLTAPLQAFFQLVDISSSDIDADVHNDAESILSASFSKWEVILCKTSSLELVWAQVLSDPFLRRLILRFIFCRSVLSLFCVEQCSNHNLPVCLPELPISVAPNSEVVQSCVIRLANILSVADCFNLKDL